MARTESTRGYKSDEAPMSYEYISDRCAFLGHGISTHAKIFIWLSKNQFCFFVLGMHAIVERSA